MLVRRDTEIGLGPLAADNPPASSCSCAFDVAVGATNRTADCQQVHERERLRRGSRPTGL